MRKTQNVLSLVLGLVAAPGLFLTGVANSDVGMIVSLLLIVGCTGPLAALCWRDHRNGLAVALVALWLGCATGAYMMGGSVWVFGTCLASTLLATATLLIGAEVRP